MHDSPACQAFRARWVFPVTGAPIAGGVVTMAGERIVEVGTTDLTGLAIDLGDVALLPGLINAHTHLEFSALAAPLGQPGEPLPTWIRRVIAWRGGVSLEQADQNVAQGLAESTRAGTTTVGEIATRGWPARFAPPVDVMQFWESLGFARAVLEERLELARRHLAQPSRENLLPGLSPHAPYSVNCELLAGLVSLAAEQHVSVAMHLAESTEELELLANGTGPFRQLLEDLGLWSDDILPRGTRVLDYLQTLAAAPRALAIHGNYLRDDEVDFLAEHSERLALVYCPRTHAYFGHPRYPLERLLQSGVRVALGTDGRASNPDLSLLAELRFVANRYPQLAPAVVLELGTIAGARALGRERELGSLAPGKLANLIAVPLRAGDAANPHELLFDSQLPASRVWHRGREIELTAGSW